MNHKRCKDKKPTTPRLPSGAAWGTKLLVLGLVIGSLALVGSLPFGGAPQIGTGVHGIQSAQPATAPQNLRTAPISAARSTDSLWSKLSSYVPDALLSHLSAACPNNNSQLPQAGSLENTSNRQDPNWKGSGNEAGTDPDDPEKVTAKTETWTRYS